MWWQQGQWVCRMEQEGPLTPEAWFLPPAPQVVECAHVISTMDTSTQAAQQGPWKAHLPPPGKPKGKGQEPQRDKLTSGQKMTRWDSYLWASCTLLTSLDWGLPPLPRVPVMRLQLVN